MRNKYPGVCYRCQKPCAVGEGHFEKFKGGWRVQHADCAILFRGTIDPERQAHSVRKWTFNALLTGKTGQRARYKLRQLEKAKADEEQQNDK